MSKDFEQDIINIDLENLSSSDSEIDLFSYESNDINSIAQTIYIGIIDNITSPIDVKVFYLNEGVSFNTTFSSQNDLDDFVLNANSFFSGKFIFSYEYYSLTESKMFVNVLNSNYAMVKIKTTIDFLFNPYTVINGTKIAVSSDNLTYPELLQELVNQPYFFDSMSVYANTNEQAMEIVTKVKKTQAGESYQELSFPKIDPKQFQPVIEGIELNYSPSPINKLKYTVKGSQSLSLWFYYRHRPIISLKNKKVIDIDSKDINQNESKPEVKIMNVKKSIYAPMFLLANKNVAKKKSIKDLIKSKSKLRDITQISENEVFKAFDDTDFKEII